MTKSADIPPPPRGAGAGGGGRAEPSAPIGARENIPLGNRTEGSIGWGPNLGQSRQREFKRANVRAKRLRKEMTPSEMALWKLLRDVPDAHFRKQVAVDHWVFDFAEFGARLLIELDGGVHEIPDVAFRDAEKQKRAEYAGFNVLRLTNADVAGRPEWVLEQVHIFLKAPHPLPPPRKGEGEEGAQ